MDLAQVGSPASRAHMNRPELEFEKIYKLRKRAARVILEADMYKSSNSLSKQLNWLTIR